MSEHEGSEDIVFDPSILAGSWADATRVHLGRDELTIDFVRRIPRSAERVLVARVILAPIVGAALGDQLHDAWQGYDARPMTGVDDRE